MGMHIGFIAVKTTASGLREAFSEAWPEFETVDSQEDLADANAMWAWTESHKEFVSAADWSKDNPGSESYAFWEDGPWAVMMDSSYVLASDDDALKAMSAKMGAVLSFVVETAGGCAAFACFDNGEVRRKITYTDGELTTDGDPLPEEAGIDVDNYYMAETEALCRAFGLSCFEITPTYDNCQGVSVVDHTDYSHLNSGVFAPPQADNTSDRETPEHKPPATPQKKPWWKFW